MCIFNVIVSQWSGGSCYPLSFHLFIFGYIINLSVYFSQIVISVIDLNLETFHDKVVSEDTANRCVIKNSLKK